MRNFKVLLLLLCGSAVTGYRSSVNLGTDTGSVMGFSTSKYIAGIPVYNYENALHPEPGVSGSGSSAIQVGSGNRNGSAQQRRWIVMMRSKVTDSDIASLCMHDPDHVHCKAKGDPDHGGLGFLEVDGTESDLESIVSSKASQVDFIEPDYEVQAMDQGNISFASYEEALLDSAAPWGLAKIGVGSGGREGKGVHVYVMDTGVRTSHPDFEGRAIPTLDLTQGFLRECRGPGDYRCADDSDSHGTHCAGTIAGRRYGVAKQATVHAVKVLGSDGKGSGSWVIQGMDWILRRAHRPAIISMSLGAPGNSPSERYAIRRSVSAGIPVVVAAGNAATDACGFSPAFSPEAITVGSIDQYSRKSSFSCFGRCVNIWAPGSDIESADAHSRHGGAKEMSGTSMACPHVSGAVALMLANEPSMSVDQIRSKLAATAVRGSIHGLRREDTNSLLSVSFVFQQGGQNHAQRDKRCRNCRPNDCHLGGRYFKFCNACGLCKRRSDQRGQPRSP